MAPTGGAAPEAQGQGRPRLRRRRRHRAPSTRSAACGPSTSSSAAASSTSTSTSGISGGAFVASILAAGVSPREMYDEATDAHAARPSASSAAPLYRLGQRSSSCGARPGRPGVLSRALVTSLTGEGRNLSDLAWSFFELLPPGLMDTAGIQEYLHRVFRSRLRGDSFRDLPRELYVVAVDLDSGEAVAFGRGRLARRAGLEGRPGLRPPCPGSTARCASGAATTSTAASRRPPTSTSRSRAGPTSSSASTRSSPTSTTPRTARCAAT